MGKFFTTEVIKPTILASDQHDGTFASGNIIFDWQAVQVPRGSSALVGATVLMRPQPDASPVVNNIAIDLVFASSNSISLGTINDPALHRPNNSFLGVLEITSGHYGATQLQGTAIATTSQGSTSASAPLVLTPDINTGDNVGYDTLYVGGVSRGDLIFGPSINAVNETGFGAAAQTVITMDDASGGTTMDCREHFIAGDVLHAQDDAVLGTLASVAAQEITLTAANTDAIAENDLIYNINPIRIILQFER